MHPWNLIRFAPAEGKRTVNLSTDPLDILRLHHAWAQGLLLQRCAELSEADLRRRFEIGPGSLHDILVHILGAARYWHDRVRELDPVRPALDPAPLGEPQPARSLDEIRAIAAQSDRELESLVRDLQQGTIADVLISRQPPGKRFLSAAAVLHIFTHAVHHRAQALNILRRLRPEQPALELDLPDWQILCQNP